MISNHSFRNHKLRLIKFWGKIQNASRACMRAADTIKRVARRNAAESSVRNRVAFYAAAGLAAIELV